MIPGLPAYSEEPIILIGGPRHGTEDVVATLGPESPCERKVYPDSSYYIVLTKKGNRLKDEKGRWVFEHE